MREINVSQITDVVARLCIEANTHLPEDVKCLLRQVSDIVFEKSGIRLEPEVRIW